MQYMKMPQNQITIGGTVYAMTDRFTATRVENGFDSADLWLADRRSLNYPTNFTKGKTVKIEVKDAGESAYTTIFNGKSLYALPNYSIPDGEFVQLKCVGNGYGLSKMLVAYEYGQDVQGLSYNTLGEIIGDAAADNGIIHKWVNHLKGDLAAASGYAYTTTGVSGVTGGINYINFPYKPANKCIDDLCDQITAVKAGGAGPHWIVTTDDVIHCILMDTGTAAWPQYFKGSQADATLVQDVDFKEYGFEEMDKEANYIVYAGEWRRPSTGDYWTENTSSLWDKLGGGDDQTDENGVGLFKVGNYSINFLQGSYYYPTTKNADWDFSVFKAGCIPTIDFYARRSGATTLAVDLRHDNIDGFTMAIDDYMADADQWYYFSIPIGENWPSATSNYRWVLSGAGNWNQIDYVMFSSDAAGVEFWIDGLHFSGKIIRIAAQAAGYSAADPCLMKLVTDNVGKDDTLKAGTPGTTDVGVMARMAYTEYLRCNTTPTVGDFTTQMMPSLLPGQRLHIHAKPNPAGTHQINADMRVYELVHSMSPAEYFTACRVTSDVTNAHVRKRHDDLNKIYGDMRPEFQDRQATSIKLGALMYDVPTFVETY